MKKCPECLTTHEDSNRFCKKCGQKLKSTKSNSFRNFMIIIIVIVSIIVIGLTAYYVLANYTGNDLSSLFSKAAKLIGYQDEQVSGTSDDSSTVILTKEKLSEDQTRVVSLFGHPDQFIVIFDESNNNKRVDTWIYFDMETLFIFENGTYDDSEEYYGGKYQESKYELLPQDFIYGMTPLEVETLIGEKGVEGFDENTGLDILTFGEGEIICIFSPDSRLIIASKQNKLANEI